MQTQKNNRFQWTSISLALIASTSLVAFFFFSNGFKKHRTLEQCSPPFGDLLKENPESFFDFF